VTLWLTPFRYWMMIQLSYIPEERRKTDVRAVQA
jgi:hypothetical protein